MIRTDFKLRFGVEDHPVPDRPVKAYISYSITEKSADISGYRGTFLEELTTWLFANVSAHPILTYAILFGVAVGENIVPPIPGDGIMVFSGYLVGRGLLRFDIVYGVMFVGHVVGFMLLFELGRRWGREVVRRLPWLRATEPWIDRAEQHALKHGLVLIAVNRFLPGIRSVISIAVGLLRMRWSIVLVSSMVSIAVWNGLLIYGGATVGRNWEQVLELLQRYNIIVGSMVFIAICSMAIWSIIRRRTKRTNT
jgi:membrane protein DedA with SNARE-associated domain